MKRNAIAQWMNLHQNNSFVNWTQLITFVVYKIWSHTPSASGSYGRQSDEILDLKICETVLYIGFSLSLTEVQCYYSVTNGF